MWRYRVMLSVVACLWASGAWAVDRAETKFGILYAGWHCLVTQAVGARPFSVTSDALEGRARWGHIPDFHFWGTPAPGFYCLSERDDVLREHARLLREAGIDFIIFDASNVEYADARNGDAFASVMRPFTRLLEVWSGIEGAPKVVPWAPVGNTDSGMLQWMAARLEKVPNMAFRYRDKPLLLVVDNAGLRPSVSGQRQLSDRFTLRHMWGLVEGDNGVWSFMSTCQSGFLASKATIPCNQRRVRLGGRTEQMAISPAYQETYMSDKRTAVPKFEGRTFVEQFRTAFLDPPEVVVIATWNEWMAQRFCLGANGEATDKNCSERNDHWPDGSKVFVDQYDAEYNRDLEPAKGPDGDRYYRLLLRCIASFRQGKMCSAS